MSQPHAVTGVTAPVGVAPGGPSRSPHDPQRLSHPAWRRGRGAASPGRPKIAVPTMASGRPGQVEERASSDVEFAALPSNRMAATARHDASVAPRAVANASFRSAFADVGQLEIEVPRHTVGGHLRPAATTSAPRRCSARAPSCACAAGTATWAGCTPKLVASSADCVRSPNRPTPPGWPPRSSGWSSTGTRPRTGWPVFRNRRTPVVDVSRYVARVATGDEGRSMNDGPRDDG
jgi:hypothetical protein